MPERELFLGRPSGSAMPLVWAHAEHIKLLRSLADGAVFDLPPQTVQRYVRGRQTARCRIWRPDWRSAVIPCGHALRIDLPDPAVIHWSSDGWRTAHDTSTTLIVPGIHMAEIPTADLQPGTAIVFTWRRENGDWIGENYSVNVTERRD
jgi:glucoamylase